MLPLNSVSEGPFFERFADLEDTPGGPGEPSIGISNHFSTLLCSVQRSGI